MEIEDYAHLNRALLGYAGRNVRTNSRNNRRGWRCLQMPQPSIRLFAERADVLEYKEVPRLFLAVQHHLICALKYLFSLTKTSKKNDRDEHGILLW